MSYAVCIADLLGKKAREYGCPCECPHCLPSDAEAQEGRPSGVLTQEGQKPDFKKAAANDRES
jgi:hypothetical protein